MIIRGLAHLPLDNALNLKNDGCRYLPVLPPMFRRASVSVRVWVVFQWRFVNNKYWISFAYLYNYIYVKFL